MFLIWIYEQLETLSVLNNSEPISKDCLGALDRFSI